MSCPVSAGAAETANGAVERMVLLGLTGVYYIKFGCLSWGSLLVKGKGQRDWKDEKDRARRRGAAEGGASARRRDSRPKRVRNGSELRSVSRIPSEAR